MNIFQSQLVMADGRTLREHAAEELPFDCQYVKSLGPQLAPKKVSVEEFLREMQGGWGMSWRNGYGERMGDDEEYNPRRDDPNYREHPKQQRKDAALNKIRKMRVHLGANHGRDTQATQANEVGHRQRQEICWRRREDALDLR